MQEIDLDIEGFKMEKNRIKMNGSMPFFKHQGAMITKVRLRGDWTAGHHQELLIDLGDNLLRISRNNGTDTFQIGAVEEGKSKFVMNTLEELNILGKTCRDALEAFGKVHRQWPRYDQADCQTFAAEVLNKLKSPDKEDDEDDYFM